MRDNILELQITLSDQHQTQPKWSETSDTNTSFCNALPLPRGPPVPVDLSLGRSVPVLYTTLNLQSNEQD
jgi:hypothetical protein